MKNEIKKYNSEKFKCWINESSTNLDESMTEIQKASQIYVHFNIEKDAKWINSKQDKIIINLNIYKEDTRIYEYKIYNYKLTENNWYRFGKFDHTCIEKGTYKFEFWYDDVLIGCKEINVLDKPWIRINNETTNLTNINQLNLSCIYKYPKKEQDNAIRFICLDNDTVIEEIHPNTSIEDDYTKECKYTYYNDDHSLINAGSYEIDLSDDEPDNLSHDGQKMTINIGLESPIITKCLINKLDIVENENIEIKNSKEILVQYEIGNNCMLDIELITPMHETVPYKQDGYLHKGDQFSFNYYIEDMFGNHFLYGGKYVLRFILKGYPEYYCEKCFRVVDKQNIQLGNTIEYGKYPQGENGEIKSVIWNVLDYDKSNHEILVISRDILDASTFNDEVNTTYENSTIQKYLINKVKPELFTERESEFVQNIFLLSFEDMNHYFKQKPERVTMSFNNFMADIYDFGKKAKANQTPYVMNNFKLYTDSDNHTNWWLNTPSECNNRSILFVDNHGKVNSRGSDLIDHPLFGIRPAMKVKVYKHVIVSK